MGPIDGVATAVLLLQPGHDQRYRARWSNWRRHHQYTARACHYGLRVTGLAAQPRYAFCTAC
jgi:hypothetical protein